MLKLKSQTNRSVTSSDNYIECLQIFRFSGPGGKTWVFLEGDDCHLTHQCLTTAIETDRQSRPQLCLWMIDHDGCCCIPMENGLFSLET